MRIFSNWWYLKTNFWFWNVLWNILKDPWSTRIGLIVLVSRKSALSSTRILYSKVIRWRCPCSIHTFEYMSADRFRFSCPQTFCLLHKLKNGIGTSVPFNEIIARPLCKVLTVSITEAHLIMVSCHFRLTHRILTVGKHFEWIFVLNESHS